MPISNVTVKEVVLTVVLAVLVCVMAGLLLSIQFYRDIWVFWFCFVVGTAHFSLIKVTVTETSLLTKVTLLYLKLYFSDLGFNYAFSFKI